MGAAVKKKEKSAAVPQSVPTSSDEAQRILDVVAEILGDRGYDALQVRDVARGARVSLTTVYADFPSKDELVVAAVERWMQERVYAELPTPRLDAPLSERLTAWYRQLFAPWAQQPAMLRVFMQAAMLPGGERLARQGLEAVAPSSQQMFEGYEPGFVAEVNLILTNVVYGLLGQFASGQVDATDMVDVVELTIQRLTAGAERSGSGTSSSTSG